MDYGCVCVVVVCGGWWWVGGAGRAARTGRGQGRAHGRQDKEELCRAVAACRKQAQKGAES